MLAAFTSNKTTKLMQAIEDYINGNLKDAKRRARNIRRPELRRALVENYGKSLEAAVAIVDFLKDDGSFAMACECDKARRV